MKIKAESLPVRCEICHQSDEFDAGLNQCQRCREVVHDTVHLSLKSTKSEKKPRWARWRRRIETGLKIWIFGYGMLLLSGVTPVDELLVFVLPIDADWISQARHGLAHPTFVMPFLAFMIALIVSVLEKRSCLDFSVVEWAIIAFVTFFIGALVLPSGSAPRRSYNCARALNVLKKIQSAQEAYRVGPGGGHYAKTLAALRLPQNSTDALNRIEARLENVGYYGYQVVSFHTFPATETAPPRYEIQLAPSISTGRLRSGNDAYFLDQTGNIRHSGSPTKLADVNSDPVF